MLAKIEQLLQEIEGLQAANAEELEALRIKYLSKKGAINELMADFRNVPAEQKKEVGMKLNELKNKAQERIASLKEAFETQDNSAAEMDLTRTAYPIELGTRHPLSIVNNEIIDIFHRLGFSIADGALSKGVCVSEGISGLYSATIKGNKIYAFGYNIANADKQGSSLFEFDGENANENVIATTNEPASAGYPTTFYAKFVNSSLLAGVRAKGKGINVLGNVYDYTNQKDFTATVMSINLKDVFGGISTTETADDARIWAVSGAVKISVASPTSVAVYNVAGQIVAKRIVTDETTIALPAGFYIVNGKKVVVK